jgi:hypothetical protein
MTLTPEVDLDLYGFVVAADALAQTIFSPLFGYLVNYTKSTLHCREAMVGKLIEHQTVPVKS